MTNCERDYHKNPMVLTVVFNAKRGRGCYEIAVDGRVPGDSPGFQTKELARERGSRFFRMSLNHGTAVWGAQDEY